MDAALESSKASDPKAIIAEMHEIRASDEREIDQDATDLVRTIMMQVSLLTTSPEELSLTMDGHYCRISLTDLGQSRLAQQLFPHVRGKLFAQRSAGQISIMKERRLYGGLT